MSVSNSNPLYFCPLGDKFINLDEADLLVVSKNARRDLPKPGEPISKANVVLRRAYEEEAEEVEDICRYFWDETEVYRFDQTFSINQCNNILALAEGEIAGLLSWKKVEDTQIMVVLNVYPEFQGQGIGRMLVKEVMEQGRKQGCKRIRVATTNDDLPALALYQKLGFQLHQIFIGRVAEHHGEELPGFAGIPIRDEVQLEREL
jgi:ribosomal protein S18 acetylase RimI-like enzyme